MTTCKRKMASLDDLDRAWHPWELRTTPRDVFLSVDPLIALVKLRYDEPKQGWTRSRIAKLLNLSEKKLHRWEKVGLRIDEADRLAVSLKFHPTFLWGDEFHIGTEIRREP